MSRNEWERGEFVIPSAEWAPLKKALREAHNARRAKTFEVAQKIGEIMNGPRYKGKRNVQFFGRDFDELDIILEEMAGPSRNGFGGVGRWGSVRAPTPSVATIEDVCPHELAQILAPAVFDYKTPSDERQAAMFKRPNKPTQKALETVIPQAKNTTLVFGGSDFDIRLDDKNRTLVWDVGESNHACDNARSHILGRVLFDRLSKIQWTRDTGGEIVGNDEYAREADDGLGGGANYTKGGYGPRGDINYRLAHSMSRQSSFSGPGMR